MPELPEVQTTVNLLAPAITGRNIMRAWMDPRKFINTGSNMSWPTIRQKLPGRKVVGVARRAKFIVIRLDDNSSVWVHQKMTGHLLVGTWEQRKGQWISTQPGPLAEDPMNRFIRLVISFDDGTQMALSDARRFARLLYIPSDADIPLIKEVARLGPEPLTLSPAQFTRMFSEKRGRIKAVLMDPSHIVGIGNIYADEILHQAGIHPLAQTHTLSGHHFKKVHRAMRSILTRAIAAGGSSTDDYRTPDGKRGGYQNRHRAYHRTGQSCTLCHTGVIERIVAGGRSTHFCPNHQPLTT